MLKHGLLFVKLLDNTADDGCHCKEEVEKEEAEALAEALERSDLPQDALPHVPGLSRLKSESTLTIHLQDQVNNCVFCSARNISTFCQLF